MEKAHKLAVKTLTEEKTLFLKISEYLSKNPKMSSKTVKEMSKKHLKTIDYIDILENKEDFYLKKLNMHLKNEL
jgi:hypothetical protein